ncbi:MAG: hypothetical protein BGO14_07215 [Chlamydiales bacterium 38-26]|nr:hypothetical protein [Chlamydiales bacterium]OJV10793.1 MAG: hypothetical protein BGO14_07215 [Chlamydiales bacterium 38-26]
MSAITGHLSQTIFSFKSTVEKKGVRWWIHLLPGMFTSRYISKGLAKMSGFEELRHGTSWPNYFGILRKGACPEKGGSTTNHFDLSKYGTFVKPMNKFYVFKDTEATLLGKRYALITYLMTTMGTRMHATLAGNAHIKRTNNLGNKIKKIVCAIFLGMTAPTLKFFYHSREIPSHFKNDEDYGGLAYYTEKTISNDRIGIVGICKHAKSKDMTLQFRTKPLRATYGVIQVILGIFLTLSGLGLIF